MAVYVDEMVNNLWNLRGRTVKNCHMWSDKNTEELLEFADKIGLKRRWIQRSRRGLIHFDLVARLRQKAIQHGAIPVTNREASKIWERMRDAKEHNNTGDSTLPTTL